MPPTVKRVCFFEYSVKLPYFTTHEAVLRDVTITDEKLQYEHNNWILCKKKRKKKKFAEILRFLFGHGGKFVHNKCVLCLHIAAAFPKSRRQK